MKILIIRHGDPDYENDTLTEHGRLEAEYLAEHSLRYGFLHGAAANDGLKKRTDNGFPLSQRVKKPSGAVAPKKAPSDEGAGKNL